MGRDYGLTPEPLCLVLSLPRKHTLTDQQLHTRLLIRSRNSTSLKPTRLLTRFLLFLYTPHHCRNAGSPRITSTNVRGNLWTSGKLPRDRGDMGNISSTEDQIRFNEANGNETRNDERHANTKSFASTLEQYSIGLREGLPAFFQRCATEYLNPSFTGLARISSSATTEGIFLRVAVSWWIHAKISQQAAFAPCIARKNVCVSMAQQRQVANAPRTGRRG